MLAAASWRLALKLFQDAEHHYAWHERETEMGPYLALEGVPSKRDRLHGVALVDYHICYSPSYHVPVMYLRAACADGAPLSHVDMLARFPSWPSEPDQLAGFVTQQEHPLLPGPCWYALHPCNTAVALALALGLEADRAEPATEPPSDAVTAVLPLEAAVAAATGFGRATHGALTDGGHNVIDGRTARLTESERSAAAAANAGVKASTCGSTALGDPESGGLRIPADHGESNRSPGPQRGPVEGAACSGAREHSAGGVTNDEPPDVDDLLAGVAGAEVAGSSGAALAAAVVGPAGVRWPGGRVPLCPGDPASLRRYMRAWYSLVGPHVGLQEGRFGAS